MEQRREKEKEQQIEMKMEQQTEIEKEQQTETKVRWTTMKLVIIKKIQKKKVLSKPVMVCDPDKIFSIN